MKRLLKFVGLTLLIIWLFRGSIYRTAVKYEEVQPFPVSLVIGKEFHLGNQSFSIGLKGYYGLNEIADDAPGKGHYYGFGALLAINL